MPRSAQGAVQHFSELEGKAREAAGWFSDLQQQAKAAKSRVEAQVGAQALELARVYLPELSIEALARAERLTGFQGFRRRSPLDAMAHEEVVLKRRIEKIRQDPRYQERERLVGRIGSLVRAVEEAKQMLEPFEAECQRFESLEGFLELVQAQYDTPEFHGKWWTGEYWKQWAQGDAICKALGMNDFGDDVLPAYRVAVEPRDYWRAAIAEKEKKVAEVHALVEEHDRALARIPNLPQLFLEESHQVLANFLSVADFGLLERWALKEPTEDRGIAIGLRTLAGLKAKEGIFAEMAASGLGSLTNTLEERASRYRRKQQKYARPKVAGRVVPDKALDLGFEQKHQRLGAQRDKTAALIQRIEAYDHYERFPLDNDPELWWVEFSGGRPANALVPRYQRWFERRPNARPRLEDREAEVEDATAVAAALVSEGLEGEGYLS